MEQSVCYHELLFVVDWMRSTHRAMFLHDCGNILKSNVFVGSTLLVCWHSPMSKFQMKAFDGIECQVPNNLEMSNPSALKAVKCSNECCLAAVCWAWMPTYRTTNPSMLSKSVVQSGEMTVGLWRKDKWSVLFPLFSGIPQWMHCKKIGMITFKNPLRTI